MKLQKGDKVNFQTLLNAAANNRLALLRVQRKSDNKPVAALVAVSGPDENEEFTFVPLATMVEGNPYELFNPPNSEGGYCVEA